MPVLEPLTFNFDSELIKEKTLIKCPASAITIVQYYDLHGEYIGQGEKNIVYDAPKIVEIISQRSRIKWKYSEPTITERWVVKIDGETMDDIDCTSYKYDQRKKQLILHDCTGAG